MGGCWWLCLWVEDVSRMCSMCVCVCEVSGVSFGCRAVGESGDGLGVLLLLEVVRGG